MIKMKNDIMNVKTWLKLSRAGIHEIDISKPFSDYREDKNYIFCYAVDLEFYHDEFDEIIPCVAELVYRGPFEYDGYDKLKLWEVNDVKESLKILINTLGYYYTVFRRYPAGVKFYEDLLWDQEKITDRRLVDPFPIVITKWPKRTIYIPDGYDENAEYSSIDEDSFGPDLPF